MEFRDRIKILREKKGKTPSELAVAFSKSESAVRMWELGRSKPDADTLIKLAEYFDCSTDYLLGLSDAPSAERAARLADDMRVVAPAIDKYAGHTMQYSKRPAIELLAEMIPTHWFSNIMLNLDAYIEYDESQPERFLALSNKEGMITPPLDHYIISAMRQTENLCKFLRKQHGRSIAVSEEDPNAET